MHKINYRPDIDGLRAVAVISVLLYHAGAPAFSGGFVGVDIFFVISGFLITSIIAQEIREERFSFATFYVRRAARILPALFAMLAAVTVGAYFYLLPSELMDFGQALSHAVLFAANFFYAEEQNYFAEGGRSDLLLHVWSLAVEEQFYILWPLALLGLWCRRLRAYLAPIVVTLLLLSLAASEWLLTTHPTHSFYLLHTRAWEFLVGAALALGFLAPLRRRAMAEILSSAGLVLMLAPVFMYTHTTSFPGLSALPPVIGCALLIYANGAHETLAARALKLRPIVFVGLISYSLYLWHWPALQFLSLHVGRELTAGEAAMALAVSVILAVLSWRFVERPFRRMQTRGQLTFRHTVAVTAAASAVFVAYGGVIQIAGGLPGRLPADVTAILNSAQTREDGAICTISHGARLTVCDLGPSPNSPLDLLLWGDSHAHHYTPAIASILGNNRLQGVSFHTPSCPPFLQSDLNFEKLSDRKKARCTDANVKALAAISVKQPKSIVIAAKWSRYFNASNKEATLKTLENTIGLIREKSSAPIFILAQALEMPGTPVSCAALKVWHGESGESCFRVTKAQALALHSPALEVFEKLKSKHVIDGYFNPLNHMCDDDFCYSRKNGVVFHTDDDHITPTAALYLSNFIQLPGVPGWENATNAISSDVTISSQTTANSANYSTLPSN